MLRTMGIRVKHQADGSIGSVKVITLSPSSLLLCLLPFPVSSPPPSLPTSILPLASSEYKAPGTITSLFLIFVPSHSERESSPRELAPSAPSCHRMKQQRGAEISMYECSLLSHLFDINSRQTGSHNLSGGFFFFFLLSYLVVPRDTARGIRLLTSRSFEYLMGIFLLLLLFLLKHPGE